jgi:hypothetical protein
MSTCPGSKSNGTSHSLQLDPQSQNPLYWLFTLCKWVACSPLHNLLYISHQPTPNQKLTFPSVLTLFAREVVICFPSSHSSLFVCLTQHTSTCIAVIWFCLLEVENFLQVGDICHIGILSACILRNSGGVESFSTYFSY